MVSGHLSLYIDELQSIQGRNDEKHKKIFYVVHVGGQRYRSDDSKEKNDAASFDDEIKFEVPNGVNSVLLQVYENHSIKKNLIAEGTYPLQVLYQQGQEQANITVKGEINAKLVIRASFQPGNVQVDDAYFSNAFKDHEHRYQKPPGDVGYEDPQKKLTSKDKTAIGIGAGVGGAAILGGIGYGIYKGVEKHKEKRSQSGSEVDDKTQ